MSAAKLSDGEKAVLTALADAWNQWCALPGLSEHDCQEFMQSIHRAQAVVGMRVARRADPEIWRHP